MAEAVHVVRVGIGVIVRDPRHPGKVFAGLRRNSHGDGTLALPGGHLEMYESWERCAMRETFEETGLALRTDSLRFGYATNDVMSSIGRHYVTIFMMGECADVDARPRDMEPHKCHGWNSYSWDELSEYASASSAVGIVESTDDGDGHPSNDNDYAGDDDGHRSGPTITLFGPLLKLVEDAPRRVVDFINNTS
ncbi:hypothetical protein ACHAXA_004864 [Cyclostephanos tholiformis]|uniref:Nudix hydrolase domain-containing protein n=1 Tax=Cyclostephanos tholiformis TaxID=382380 RepID=A0ABD3SH84_9STRA